MLRNLHNDLSRLNECIEGEQPTQAEAQEQSQKQSQEQSQKRSQEQSQKQSQEQSQKRSQEQSQKLISEFVLMAEKLKDTEAEVLSGEVIAIFAQIDDYLGTVRVEQRQNVMKLEAYNSERRLDEAMRREGGIAWETNVQTMLGDIQQKDNQLILQLLSPNVLSSIQTKLKEIALFRILTNDSVQQKYKFLFHTSFFKREDLQKEKAEAEAKLSKMAPFGDEFDRALLCTCAACSLCCCGKDNVLDDCCRDQFKVFGFCACPVVSLLTCFFSFPLAACSESFKWGRKKLTSKKIEKLSKRIVKLNAEMEQQQQKEAERGQPLFRDGTEGRQGGDRCQDGRPLEDGQQNALQDQQELILTEHGQNPFNDRENRQIGPRLRHGSNRTLLQRGLSWKKPNDGEGTSAGHLKEH